MRNIYLAFCIVSSAVMAQASDLYEDYYPEAFFEQELSSEKKYHHDAHENCSQGESEKSPTQNPGSNLPRIREFFSDRS